MLNLPVIQGRMTAMGLSQAALARLCDVSREAVSCWLSGVTHPRPSALRRLAVALGLELDALLIPDSGRAEVLWIPAQTWTSGTRVNAPRYDYASFADDMGSQLSTVIAKPVPLFARPTLVAPVCEPDYLEQVLDALDLSLGAKAGLFSGASDAALSALADQHTRFGSTIVPVRWSRPGWAHSGAVVSLPASSQVFVYVNVRDSLSGVIRTLAEALGACYAWRAAPPVRADFQATFADALGVTRGHRGQRGHAEGPALLADGGFPNELFRLARDRFGSDIYETIAAHQRREHGRDPAFISGLLALPLADALELSIALLQA